MRAGIDVLVVGAGNAALCAALAAAQRGAKVTALECASRDESGGNSRFTAGAFRCVYDGVDDLRALMPDLTDAEIARTDFGAYPQQAFYDDMGRVTQYRCDPDLVETLVTSSRDTMRWLRDCGVRWAPIWGRQAFEVDGKFTFWGGLTVEAVGGGHGLVERLTAAAEDAGVRIEYDTRACALLTAPDGNRVIGVRALRDGRWRDLHAARVVLACGGFEANHAWRARYLGAGWDLARVRGTRFNTGAGLQMAMDIGAAPYGHWSGCHAVGWELNAPEFGDLSVGDNFQKHSYPFSVMLNADGERFVDEGADWRNFTYAKYGGIILRQPGQFAWQVFDSQVAHLLRDEYRIRQVTRVTAPTIEQLVDKLDGVDAERALATIRAFNRAVQRDVSFDPNRKDGRAARGIDPPKSNWANPIEVGPFEGYAVTCGITFTFGGLRIDPRGAVLDVAHRPIEGLYAAGEMVGGLFYFNYPGGTGLMSGAVFGRLAGTSAAA